MNDRMQNITSEDLKTSVYVVSDEDIVYDDGEQIKFKYYDKEKDRVALFYAQQLFLKVESSTLIENDYRLYTCLTESEVTRRHFKLCSNKTKLTITL